MSYYGHIAIGLASIYHELIKFRISLQSWFLATSFIVLNPDKEPISEWAQGGQSPPCKGVQQTSNFKVCDSKLNRRVMSF
jgi:hypothetical protein